MDEQPDKALSVRWDGKQWLSGDGLWAWSGSEWLRTRSTAVAVISIGAGVLMLLLALFAFALGGGDTGPSTMDLAVLASWAVIAVALLAAGFGFALGKRWSYWLATIGVLVPSAITALSLWQDSHRVPPLKSVAIGFVSEAPGDAANYSAIFLASIGVGLIAVSFRRSWVRWLAMPVIIFMGLSCFLLPAALVMLLALAGPATRKYWRVYGFSVFKGTVKAASDAPGAPNF